MKNFVQPGNTVTVTAPVGGVTSGAGVLIGSLFGIAAFSAVAAAEVEITTVGVFDINAESGASTAITVGAPVYWDASNARATGTSTSNTLIGVAIAAKADGGTTVRVRLNGSFS